MASADPPFVPMNLDDVNELDKAIVSGLLSVHYKDRTETYQSLATMLQIRKWAKRKLATKKRPVCSFAGFNRGER